MTMRDILRTRHYMTKLEIYEHVDGGISMMVLDNRATEELYEKYCPVFLDRKVKSICALGLHELMVVIK